MDTWLINMCHEAVLCRCTVDLVLWVEEGDFSPEVKTGWIPVLGYVMFSWSFLQAQVQA